MRIRSLGLKRYGKFTDATIDFGDRAASAQDLHVVYGPNEAGKSTAMAAFLDLLYGIGAQSRFNFLHPYPTMRIEAETELKDGARKLARIKRPQNSLLDTADQPIPEAILLGELGGVDRPSYQTMFCLDDETLEAGGESILASKGDLGQLLFSASAGLADLSTRLGKAQAEADTFFRKGKRSGELADLKATLATLKAKREEIDTLASDYARLATERDDAAAKYDDAVKQRGRTQARIEEIQRLLSAAPRLATLRTLRQEEAPLAALPEAPEHWAIDLPDLMTRETELATQARTAAETVAQLTTELDLLVVDKAACAIQGQIELLVELRARHVTAEKDLPGRRLQLGGAEQVVAGLLTRIGRPDELAPEKLLLATSVTGPLRDLIEKRSGVEAALVSARNEAENAREALEVALEQISQLGTERDEDASRALAVAVAASRLFEEAGSRRTAIRVHDDRSEEFADRLLELRPWQGDQNALLSLSTPGGEEIESWASRDGELLKALSLGQADVDRLGDEIERLDAKIAELEASAGVVSDSEAAEVRSAREAAWSAHSTRLDAGTAAAFESAMRRDDIVSELRIGHSVSVAEINGALLDRAGAKVALDQATRRQAARLSQRQAIAGEVAATIRNMGGGLGEEMGHASLKIWLEKRKRAIETRERLAIAERDLRQTQADTLASRDRLAKALQAAQVKFDFEDDIPALLAAGQLALDRDAAAQGHRKAVEDLRRDVKAREAKLTEATSAESAWIAAWRAVCGGCWLAEADETPELGMVRETLDAVAELAPALDKKIEFVDRIAKMERDQALFATEVKKLASDLDLASRPTDIVQLCQMVQDSAAHAATTLARQTETESRLNEAKEKSRLIAEDLALINARKLEMIKHFNVASLTEVDSCLRKLSRKQELSDRLAEAKAEILEALEVETIEDAEAKLDALDRSALEAEREEQKTRFQDEDRRIQDLFSVHSKAKDSIDRVGGDAAVAQIEEQRRTILLAIEDKAMAHLRLRLGAAAAEKALRAYRDRHRSSMMKRASESFSLISRGAYSGLVTQPKGESEILIATGKDGSSKIASELSKGTRFQLYLALRVAGYHEFARAHAPAPFLADDIMETFDDFRAEEAFRLLAGMSTVGQVVYFTHHRHLCDIAKAVAPGVIIHNLETEPRGV
jgi:uncharacterized protein YhaN